MAALRVHGVMTDHVSRVTSLLAGAIGGAVGALAFGLLMLTRAILTEPSLEGRGLLPVLEHLSPWSSPAALWALHVLLGTLFGTVFALAVPASRGGTSLIAGLGWGLVLWIVLGQITARLLLGMPIRFDGITLHSLIGHTVYGLGLGLAYVPVARALHQVKRQAGGALAGEI